MANLQYRGLSHYREISDKDFESVGLTHESIRLGRHDLTHVQNSEQAPLVVEVSQEVADWLLKNEKGDWKVVTDEKAAKLEEQADASDAPDARVRGTVETAPSTGAKSRARA